MSKLHQSFLRMFIAGCLYAIFSGSLIVSTFIFGFWWTMLWVGIVVLGYDHIAWRQK